MRPPVRGSASGYAKARDEVPPELPRGPSRCEVAKPESSRLVPRWTMLPLLRRLALHLQLWSGFSPPSHFAFDDQRWTMQCPPESMRNRFRPTSWSPANGFAFPILDGKSTASVQDTKSPTCLRYDGNRCSSFPHPKILGRRMSGPLLGMRSGCTCSVLLDRYTTHTLPPHHAQT